MARFKSKVKLWTDAKTELKFEYWKAMQYNFEVLEKKESKNELNIKKPLNFEDSDELDNQRYEEISE